MKGRVIMESGRDPSEVIVVIADPITGQLGINVSTYFFDTVRTDMRAECIDTICDQLRQALNETFKRLDVGSENDDGGSTSH